MNNESQRRRASVLLNRTRQRICDEISAAPGLSLSQIARTLRITYQTVAYHLNILEKSGHIVTVEHGNRRLCFRAGGGLNEDGRRILSLCLNPLTAKAAHLVRHAPWIMRKEIGIALGISRTTATWHLSKLIRGGIVHEARESGTSFLFVDPVRYRQMVDLLSLESGLPRPPRTHPAPSRRRNGAT